MKRMYVGLALLLSILVLGIVLAISLRQIHSPLAEVLEQAREAALSGDWSKATALAAEARADWDQFRNFTAAAADQEPLERMDALFARLEVLGRLQDREQFAVCCGDLSDMAAAMADSQKITWWNLF